MQLLFYHIIFWLSQLALVTTPMLKSLPFDLIKDLSAAAGVIGLLSGATDSLPLLPLADYIPVLDVYRLWGLWDQRSDWLELVSFQIAFIPLMTATGLIAVSSTVFSFLFGVAGVSMALYSSQAVIGH